MKKFDSSTTQTYDITFRGVEYGFIINPDMIGIRRKDQKNPTVKELEYLTKYLITEGWADHLKYLLDNGNEFY